MPAASDDDSASLAGGAREALVASDAASFATGVHEKRSVLQADAPRPAYDVAFDDVRRACGRWPPLGAKA